MRKCILVMMLALLTAAGSALAMDVQSIGGEYVGKVKDAKGVSTSKGDACHVSIDPEARGNTVSFKVPGARNLAYVERKEVERGLKSGSSKVKLTTTSNRGRKVIVVLKVKGKRLKFIRVTAFDHAQVRWTVACGGLARN